MIVLNFCFFLETNQLFRFCLLLFFVSIFFISDFLKFLPIESSVSSKYQRKHFSPFFESNNLDLFGKPSKASFSFSFLAKNIRNS